MNKKKGGHISERKKENSEKEIFKSNAKNKELGRRYKNFGNTRKKTDRQIRQPDDTVFYQLFLTPFFQTMRYKLRKSRV
jgi:hypothetical protein